MYIKVILMCVCFQKMGSMDGDDVEVRVEVPHVRQRHSWDCGLACLQMVLRHFSIPEDDFKDVCKNLNFGDSVWTIDLAYMLHHYKIRQLFCTVTVGVDKGYSAQSFYKDRFSADELRVNNLFSDVKTCGVAMEKRSVELDDIILHLKRRQLLIVLIDWNHLNCKWCPSSRCFAAVSCLGKCITAYQGHFILVCGYNSKDKLIYYKNPSFGVSLCCCSMKTFDIARKSYGTDEDLVFVYDQIQSLPKPVTVGRGSSEPGAIA